MKHIIQPDEGDTLRLGALFPGEIRLTVDPQQTGNLLVCGTHTLSPRTELVAHRHLTHDEVWIIQKGQGRATVNGETMTVVPGMTVVVPRHTWHQLRNTGTGLLQIAWVSAPPGIEALFRELSQRREEILAEATIEDIATRHGVEFRTGPVSTAEKPKSPRHRRRHRSGRRRGEKPQVAGVGVPPQGIAPAISTAPVLAPAVPGPQGPALPAGSGSRAMRAGEPRGVPAVGVPSRHPTASKPGRGLPVPSQGRQAGQAGRRRRRHRATPRAEAGPSTSGSAVPPASAPRAPAASPRAARHRRARVKEVYMGGRWVQVTGEGPVIST